MIRQAQLEIHTRGRGTVQVTEQLQAAGMLGCCMKNHRASGKESGRAA